MATKMAKLERSDRALGSADLVATTTPPLLPAASVQRPTLAGAYSAAATPTPVPHQHSVRAPVLPSEQTTTLRAAVFSVRTSLPLADYSAQTTTPQLEPLVASSEVALLRQTTLQVGLVLEAAVSVHPQTLVVVCLVRTSLRLAAVSSAAVPRPTPPQHLSEVVPRTLVARLVNRTPLAVVSLANPTTRPPLPPRSEPTTPPQTPAAVSSATARVEASDRTTRLLLRTTPLEVSSAVAVVASARTTTTSKSPVASSAVQALATRAAAASLVKPTRPSQLLAACSAVLLLTTTPTTLEVVCSGRSLLLAAVLYSAATMLTLDHLVEACSAVLGTTTTLSRTQEVVSLVAVRTITNKSLAGCLAALHRTRTLEAVSLAAEWDSRTTNNRVLVAHSSRTRISNRSSRASATACSGLREALF